MQVQNHLKRVGGQMQVKPAKLNYLQTGIGTPTFNQLLITSKTN